MKTQNNITLTLLAIAIALLMLNFVQGIVKMKLDREYQQQAAQQRAALERLLKNNENENAK